MFAMSKHEVAVHLQTVVLPTTGNLDQSLTDHK